MTYTQAIDALTQRVQNEVATATGVMRPVRVSVYEGMTLRTSVQRGGKWGDAIELAVFSTEIDAASRQEFWPPRVLEAVAAAVADAVAVSLKGPSQRFWATFFARAYFQVPKS